MSQNSDLGQAMLEELESCAVTIEPSGGPPAYNFIDSAEFITATYSHEWLVKHVLVANQPGVIGGSKKTLKTSLLIELAVSLAAGGDRKFLGEYAVPTKRRVAVISGESGEATLQETALRVCKAKGVNAKELPIFWGFTMPALSNPDDLRSLERGIEDLGIDVIAIDPLYLSLLAGNTTVQASNLYHVGPLMRDVAEACLGAGATPLLIHHAKKAQGTGNRQRFGPMELEDLAFSGIQEFARQWMLVSRRSKYEPGSGKHELWLTVGGSTGVSGLKAVDIDEGKLDDDFKGRTWSVVVRKPAEVMAVVAQVKEEQKAQKKKAKAEDTVKKVLDVLGKAENGDTLRQIARAVGLSNDNAKVVLNELVAEGKVQSVKVTKQSGKKGTKEYDGFKLVQQANQLPVIDPNVTAAQDD